MANGNSEVFKEFVINHNLIIPDVKPPMEAFLQYKIQYEITKAEVIDTRLLTDDDPPLPIRKVIVAGVAKILVKYVAEVPDQQVHGAHFEEPFSQLIEWPDGPTAGTSICVEIVEEYVNIYMLDERTLSKTIVLQLNITLP
ncbi:SPOCS domain-containing protein [Oceanirhabdus sp. W0125-5]|uniref:SPOCS domain-containing protein n=1 Tax=Oceanirhabdus sp. W0125-5 TaxID=2999116 RepID=UPI0022F2C3D0|nr:SPOCS domain-containing protein [Oceanirhabdus sp. W0125-5]WBW96629.1 DUF3794 domain-containing protein [Oceanirhabdus sp. W0125-5]